MKWLPWVDFEDDSTFAIPVAEPPCKECAHWRPRRLTDRKGDFDGIVLCTKIGDQCNDFSCYRERPHPAPE